MKPLVSLRILTALSLLGSPAVRAQEIKEILAPPTAATTVSTAEAMKEMPKCDGQLLDKLYESIHQDACLRLKYDATCSRLLLRYSKAATAAAAATGLPLMFAVNGYANKKLTAKLKDIKLDIKSDIHLNSENDRFQRYLKQALKPTNADILGLEVPAEKRRQAALDLLEKVGQNKKLVAKISVWKALESKKLWLTVSEKVAGKAAYMIPVVGVGIAAVDQIYSALTPDPTQGPCQDHGMAFIDYETNQADTTKCEFSFRTTGPRVQNFLKLPRAEQEKVLAKHPATCEYFHKLNQHIEGKLLIEVAKPKPTFKSLPVCNKTSDAIPKVTGVTYEVEVAGKSYKLRSRNDPASKKIRNLTIYASDAVDENDRDMFEYYDEPGQDGQEIKKTRVYSRRRNSQANVSDFEDYLDESKKYPDSRAAKTMRVLDATNIYTPLIASCCEEADPKTCFSEKIKLPGLKEEIGPSELLTAPVPAPVPAPTATPTPGKQ